MSTLKIAVDIITSVLTAGDVPGHDNRAAAALGVVAMAPIARAACFAGLAVAAVPGACIAVVPAVHVLADDVAAATPPHVAAAAVAVIGIDVAVAVCDADEVAAVVLVNEDLTAEADTGFANSAEIQYAAAVLVHHVLDVVAQAAGDLRCEHVLDFQPSNS
jgi:hypothetical protein